MPEKPKGPLLPPREPHTEVKHAILNKYLKAWFPILTSAKGFTRVIYIDGFAGSGIYEDGSEGSPLIAIKTALNTQKQIGKQVDFIFIEQDQQRFENLDKEVQALAKPSNFSYQVRQADFAERMPRILDYYDNKGGFNAAFVFIDPFGYKSVPIDLIARIMRHRSCEVLITFMYQEINRFLSVEPSDEARNQLFGTNAWQQVENESDPKRRKEFLHNLYQQQLIKAAGIKFVRSFEMVNIRNSTDFFLFFGTNSSDGLREMKRAMWSVDETGGSKFSDRTNPNQLVFFDTPDFDKLKDLLRTKFKGKIVPFEEVENFVLEDTAFRHDAHLKKDTLKPMEDAGEIEVLEVNRQPRKGRAYKEGFLISFR